MIVPSSLLSVFGKHDGTLQPVDSVLTIPPTIVPVSEIPTTVKRIGLGILDVINDSFNVSVTDTVLNGSVNATIAIVSPGLWDFHVWASFIADYTALTERNNIYTSFEGTPALARFPTFWSFLNNVQFQEFHWRQAVNVQYSLNRELTANGVGQTKRFECMVIGNRLA